MKARKTVLAFILVLALILSLGVSAFAAKGSKAAYATTAAFLKVLDEEGIKYENNGIDEDEDEYIYCAFDEDNMKDIEVNIYFNKDLDSVSMRVWNVIDFDKRDLADVLALVNDINNAYKYVTFTVDLTDYPITAKLDAPLRDCEEAGEIAFDGLWYIVKICDEAYPELEFYAK